MQQNNSNAIARFEKKVYSTIKKYKLLNKQDNLLVAYSGGKDSTSILHILNKRYSVKAIFVNLGIGGYSKKNLANAMGFCRQNHIKLRVVDFKEEFGQSLCYLRSLLASKKVKLNNCTICGVLRRHLLNKKARQLKATKLVTGHNLDDEAQSILMNLLRSDFGRICRLSPISGLVKDRRFVPRVKPLYFCSEKEVEEYSKANGFDVVYGRCPCVVDSYRNQIRNLLNEIEKHNPLVKQNIVDSFLQILPFLKKKYKKEKHLINCCKICGEPNAGEVCRSCQIINMIK